MKYDYLTHLRNMAEITCQLSHPDSLNMAADIKSIRKQAEAEVNNCLEVALRQFVTPIDREDIAELALLFNRFISELCNLADFKTKYSTKRFADPYGNQLWELCKKIRNNLENGFPASLSLKILESITIPEPISPNERTLTGMTAELFFQSLWLKCFYTAMDIDDCLIRTAIKNS